MLKKIMFQIKTVLLNFLSIKNPEQKCITVYVKILSSTTAIKGINYFLM